MNPPVGPRNFPSGVNLSTSSLTVDTHHLRPALKPDPMLLHFLSLSFLNFFTVWAVNISLPGDRVP